MPNSSMASMAGVYAEDRHRLEASTSGVVWSAIIGRAFAAVPLSQILLALGSGFSLASISPWSNAGPSVTTFTVMTEGAAESGADLVVTSLRQAAEQVTMAKESWLRARCLGNSRQFERVNSADCKGPPCSVGSGDYCVTAWRLLSPTTRSAGERRSLSILLPRSVPCCSSSLP